MRAAELKERPAFSLMKQSNIQSVYHMQMPRWLFSDPRYADMSLDAKVAYTFLLNRFQLSRKNGWINDMGEVFVIFPRKALAAELRICEQRVTAAFRQLTERKLIWEKRCGRGDANQIYLATVIPQESNDYSCAPFVAEDCGSKTADSEGLAAADTQETPNTSPQNNGIGGSRATEMAAVEPQELRPSYIDLSYPGAVLAHATQAAKEKAEEVQNVIGAWSDDPANMERSPFNAALLERVRKSPALLDISKYLGRFREIFAQGKKNGYAYGRGEKYSLELGGDLSRAISSELAMLASPATLPLFLRKYQRKQIKQYQRRELIYKGAGDIICCLDESSSTAGDAAAWGKAVAMTLLEIVADGERKFALIRFSGRDSFKVDLFLPGEYTAADKLAAAETFLDGGTNFVTPLRESLRLMAKEGFENADIVFITDGACALNEEALDVLRRQQAELRFTVTGVLLDKGSPGMDFSLKAFCQNIYRTSELTGDAIVGALVGARV